MQDIATRLDTEKLVIECDAPCRATGVGEGQHRQLEGRRVVEIQGFEDFNEAAIPRAERGFLGED